MTEADTALAKRVHDYFEALLGEGFRRQEALLLASTYQSELMRGEGKREPWE